jgi:protein-S-isoprenylcysteine O-methyltransferase Ste14
MLTLLRHLLSILMLPFMAAVLVPYWLLKTSAVNDTRWNDGALGASLFRSAGIVLLLAGFALFSWCVVLFARVGQGTLAPWDPTRQLVAVGPYRLVRNPMISGVAMLLVGQALFWGSRAVAVWAGVFILVNHVYFVLSEEPGLDLRFGESYRLYKANVPRWIPRLGPGRLTDHKR